MPAEGSGQISTVNTDAAPQPPSLANCISGPIRVTYRDTDRMGYAYHSQYLVWFEIGRTDLLRSLGTAYREWEEKEGVFLPVRSADIKYRLPANYDDLVVIRTAMTRLNRASVTFQYTISREGEDVVLAEGTTTHAFVDKNGKVLRVADRLLPQFFPDNN